MSGAPGKEGGKIAPIIIKKKKNHGHAFHGGAWKLAYADLVTAMMAFFMVMWVIGMDVETGKGISRYFNNPGASIQSSTSSRSFLQLDGKPPPSIDDIDENELTLEQLELKWAKVLKALIVEEVKRNPVFKGYQLNVTTTVIDKGLRIELIEDSRGVFFASGGATMTSQGGTMMRALASQLLTAHRPMRIVGMTDSTQVDPGGMAKMDLGYARARAVHQSLIDAAYPPELIRQVGSRGQNLPTQADATRNAANRVEILLPLTPD